MAMAWPGASVLRFCGDGSFARLGSAKLVDQTLRRCVHFYAPSPRFMPKFCSLLVGRRAATTPTWVLVSSAMR
jgi:hypothetical protein